MKNVRETLIEDDELSPMEEAFMSGYEDASHSKLKIQNPAFLSLITPF